MGKPIPANPLTKARNPSSGNGCETLLHGPNPLASRSSRLRNARGGAGREIRPTPFVLRLDLVSAEEADEIDADLKDARRCYGEGNDETVRANDMDGVKVTRVIVLRYQPGADASPLRV
jgi:hypothetical protein